MQQAGLFAKKVGMTQIFDESGTIFPVTIFKTGLCQVSQIKTLVTDGYNAVQVAYGEEKLEKLTENHDKHDYVTVDVPGMNLAINVSSSLTPQERQMVIKEAILKFPNVWEVTTSKVSYPKGSIHEHPIPTNPKNPES